ncbi:MAG: hypothetical protein KDE28_11455, partial [Anaerolineales bacterium]|nr:hypothetical protein [Anaerolineales bacterium]
AAHANAYTNVNAYRVTYQLAHQYGYTHSHQHCGAAHRNAYACPTNQHPYPYAVTDWRLKRLSVL